MGATRLSRISQATQGSGPAYAALPTWRDPDVETPREFKKGPDISRCRAIDDDGKLLNAGFDSCPIAS